MTTREGDIKIFNFKEKRILNIIANEEKYKKIQLNYNKYNKFFNIPKAKFLNKDNLYLEEYLDYTPYYDYTEEEKEKGIEYILKRYEEYIDAYNKNDLKIIKLSEFVMDINSHLLIPELINKIKSIIGLGYRNDLIKIESHGDINLYNLLLHKENFYLIDWEDVNFYTITYDFINLVFIEYAFNSNEDYLIKFMQGVYDEYFNKMFNRFNLDYNLNTKVYYIALFIIEKINVLIDRGKSEVDYLTLSKFLKFLNRAEELDTQF